MLDVFDIAEASNLPLQRIRYVIDHNVIFGTYRARRGHRVTRQFEPFDAFSIAVAGWLMEGGMRRQTVKSTLAKVLFGVGPWSRYKKARAKESLGKDNPLGKVQRVPLLMAFELGAPLNLSIGDGQNLRFWSPLGPSQYDTEWFEAITLAAVKEYEPMITITVNVGRLAQNFRNLP